MTRRFPTALGPVVGGCVAIAALSSPALALSLRQALEGRWLGTGTTWTIDQDAMQVNRNPAHPFEWESLWIVATDGRMVVFDIGHDRFIGLLGAGTLTITQAGKPGYLTLARDRL
ncbi:hypothetical protein DA075_24450 [Methylobacterium currus]|uniref:Uncharacterized protein n=1 Tax=Methylobacterium currus TaxID=2051553 RepID=A0A2R4WQ30_9HYPH|nr:hypothetical protein [Methylobacterium currus]AWB23652.1 hypothetical protein DA075_24450 [Methylobacterium currus]